MPKWNPINLKIHYQKRLAKDQGCFEDLLGIAGTTMSESQYEMRADDAVNNAWCEYECEARNLRNCEYTESRAYFVDNDLLVAITDSFRRDFVTCFHEHFDKPHGVVPVPGVTVGQKQLRYKERLKIEEQGKIIRNLKRIRGV